MEETQLQEAAAVLDNWHLASSTRNWIIFGIGIYLLLMILVGFWSSRRVKAMSDFLVAGRRLPMWMATATLLATWFGAGSSMGVSATVYSDGVYGVLADPFAASISLVIAGVFFVGMLRRLKCLTVTDIIERRYGKLAGIYTSAWMIPVYVGWLGAQLLGMGTIMHVLSAGEVSTTFGTLLGAAIILIYTYAGGMWAVTLTDIIQVSLIIVGLFLIIPGALSQAGGFDAVYNQIPAEQLSLAVQSSVEGQPPLFTDWTYYIGSWIIMGLGCAVGQDVIQRSLSSKNERVAVSSAVVSGFMYMMIGLVPIVIGFVARVVLPQYGITPETLGDNAENQVLPQMAIIILGNIHPVILTVFLAALVSAIMSSADSSLLAGASLLCNNVIAPMCPRLNSDRSLLKMTRFATVLLTLLALFLATQVTSIYNLMVNSWASQLVIVFVPIVGALYVKKSGKATAWAAMTTATAIWLGYVLQQSLTEAGRALPFSELINSDLFDAALTNGAVFGFFGAIVAFTLVYACERLLGRTPTVQPVPGSRRWHKISASTLSASLVTAACVWSATLLVMASGTGCSLGQLLGSKVFVHALLVGFGYALLSAVTTLLCCYFGESMPAWVLGEESAESAGEPSSPAAP